MQRQEACTKCQCTFNSSDRFPITPCDHMVCLQCVYKAFENKETYYCEKCPRSASFFDEFRIHYDYEHEKRKEERENRGLLPGVKDSTYEEKQLDLRPDSMRFLQSRIWKHLSDGMIDIRGGKLLWEQQVERMNDLRFRENEERLKLFQEIEKVVNKYKTISDEGINQLRKIHGVIIAYGHLREELESAEIAISQKIDIIKQTQDKIMKDSKKKSEDDNKVVVLDLNERGPFWSQKRIYRLWKWI